MLCCNNIASDDNVILINRSLLIGDIQVAYFYISWVVLALFKIQSIKKLSSEIDKGKKLPELKRRTERRVEHPSNLPTYAFAANGQWLIQ